MCVCVCALPFFFFALLHSSTARKTGPLRYPSSLPTAARPVWSTSVENTAIKTLHENLSTFSLSSSLSLAHITNKLITFRNMHKKATKPMNGDAGTGHMDNVTRINL